MFTILKQQLKHKFAHIIYNFLKNRHDVEHWTRTTSCHYCAKPITIDGKFCTYCGRIVTVATRTANAGRGTRTPDTEPVNSVHPGDAASRIFLNYVRTQRDEVGPETQAHRIFQDYEQQRY